MIVNRRRQPRSWLILTGLVCAATYLLLQYSPEDLAPETQVIATAFPDTYTEGVVNHTYDQDGNLRYRLFAKGIVHQTSGQAGTQITSPEITFYRDVQSQPWYLSAEHGTRRDGTGIIALQENILISNQHTEFGRIEITTDSLEINTREESVRTDKPVTMRTATSYTTATGMNIQFKQEKFELLSKVRGIYEPL